MEHKQGNRISPGDDEDRTVIGNDTPAPEGISYAIAIYPYITEQEDDTTVIVGDTFIILQRAQSQWLVQRDPSGSGIVENDPSKQCWVPSGCLLETNVPVPSAVAKATDSNKPILPLSIISTSCPGIALMDYIRKGDELDLKKDDALRVFKEYNQWFYVSCWFRFRFRFLSGAQGVGVLSTPNTSNPAGMRMSSSTLDPYVRSASEGGKR